MEPTIIPAAGKKWPMTGRVLPAWRGAASDNGRPDWRYGNPREEVRLSSKQCQAQLTKEDDLQDTHKGIMGS